LYPAHFFSSSTMHDGGICNLRREVTEIMKDG
jgi:hypothetical protein